MNTNYAEAIFRIMGEIHKTTYQSRPTGKLPKGEFMMLTRLQKCTMHQMDCEKAEAPGVRISDLSKLVKASKPATSQMLTNLEEKNYIQRIADKKDRRVVYVTLTEEGKKELEESQSEFNLFVNTVFERLGQQDADEFIRIFNKLAKIMTDVNTEKKGY